MTNETSNKSVQFYLSKPKAYKKYMTNDEEQYIFPTPKRIFTKLAVGGLIAFALGFICTLWMCRLWPLSIQLQFLIALLFSMAFMLIELFISNIIRSHYISRLYRKASSNVSNRFNHIPSDYTK